MIMFIVLGTISSIILVTIFRGYVLTILWAWFIIPVFHLPELMIVQAIGISLVITTLHPIPLPKTDKENPYESVIYSWLLPIFSLAVGWIVKQFL